MLGNSCDLTDCSNGPKSVLPALVPTPPHLLRDSYIPISHFHDLKGLPSITASQIFQFPFLQHPIDTDATTDAATNQPIKKRRLTCEQKRLLENSFHIDSKLEPERKNKLALDLGLHPRQVAIWYQNRRARTKTKHIEDRYVALQEQYQELLQEKDDLENQVARLKGLVGGLPESNSHASKILDEKIEAAKAELSFMHNERFSSVNHYRFSNVGTTLHDAFRMEDTGKVKAQVEADSEDLSCATTNCELFCDNSPTTTAPDSYYQMNADDVTCDNACINQQSRTVHEEYNFTALYNHWNNDAALASVDDMMGPLRTQVNEVAHYCLFDLEHGVEASSQCWS